MAPYDRDKLAGGLRATDTLFLLVFASIPWVATASALGMAPIFMILALVSFGLDRWAGSRPAVSGRTLAICLVLPAWALVTAFWAPDMERAARRAATVGLLLLGVLYLAWRAGSLDATVRRSLVHTLAIGMVCVALVMAVEGLRNGTLWRLVQDALGLEPWRSTIFSRALCILVLMAIPIVAWLCRDGRGRMGLVLGLVLGFTVLSVDSDSARVGLVVAMLGGAVAALVPARVLGLFAAGGAILVILTGPWHATILSGIVSPDYNDALPFSLQHRIGIWSFVSDRIAERPLLGWGMDSSRQIPGGAVELFPKAESLPLHPHNFILQIWLELGAIGAVMLAGLLGLMIWLMATRTAGAGRVAAFALLSGYAGIAAINFGIWQSWWMSTLALAVVLWFVCFGAANESAD